jgi:hypothetical protein
MRFGRHIKLLPLQGVRGIAGGVRGMALPFKKALFAYIFQIYFGAFREKV